MNELQYPFDPELVTIEDCQEMKILKDYGTIIENGHFIRFTYEGELYENSNQFIISC